MESLALTYIYPSGVNDKYRSVHVVMKEDGAVTALPVYTVLRMLNSRWQQGTGLSIW
jgi:hypothetical protein